MNVPAKIAAVCLAAGLVITLHADEPQPSVGQKERTAEERDAILDTIAQINHINWVVNVIKSYNNVVVLEEEYEKISPGNLYLDRIPDEETLGRITKMLDTLYSLRRDDRQMKKWRVDFRESRDRQIRDYEHKVTKQALDTMTGQVKECCSLWNWVTDPLGSIANVVGTAFNMAHYSVGLHNDYDNFVYQLDKTARDKQFDFDSAKLDLLHNQNKEILQDQWQFIRRNNLDDRLRVSDVDIKMLLNSLKNENHAWIFTRLYPMRERFSLFPEYWYYLSCAAMETGHFKEGLEACDNFFKVNRGLFRDDPMAGTVAFNKAFMLPKTKENEPEIRRCLELAWTKNANVIHGDWQLDYLAAIMYKGVFDDQGKAEMMLEHAISLIEQESRDRTRYGGKAGVTLEEGLYNCRNALHQLRGEPLEQVEPQERAEVTKVPTAGTMKTLTLPGGTTMEMIYVAPGSFMMGSPESEDGRFDNEMRHHVTLTKGFWLGKYEVTQRQWESVMGENPAYFKSADRPVENVSWEDCRAFISKVDAAARQQLGGRARLPTEAEWEYACRAGTETSLPSGENLVVLGVGNGRGLNSIAWYGGNSSVGFELPNGVDCSGWKEKEFFGTRAGTHPVGQKAPNRWGFHDMIGNVYEWCNDWYGKEYYRESPGVDPQGPASGDFRVLRGGSWGNYARICRSADRFGDRPGDRVRSCGFRLCCSAGSCE